MREGLEVAAVVILWIACSAWASGHATRQGDPQDAAAAAVAGPFYIMGVLIYLGLRPMCRAFYHLGRGPEE